MTKKKFIVVAVTVFSAAAMTALTLICVWVDHPTLYTWEIVETGAGIVGMISGLVAWETFKF